MKIYILALFILIAFGCSENQTEKTLKDKVGWQLEYRNDSSGNTEFGSKKDLIKAVRMGLPIRIGFGGRRVRDSTKSVEHVADIHFLTIANGEEVFGQIRPIIGQNPDLDSDTLSISFRKNYEWILLAGTNGFSERMTTSRIKDSVISSNYRRMKASWFVNYGVDEVQNNSTLSLATRN